MRGKKGGATVPLLVLLALSLGANALLFMACARGGVARPEPRVQSEEPQYVRKVAEAFGLRPGPDRAACDIATDLKLLADDALQAPSAALAAETIDEMKKVFPAEEYARFVRGQKFLETVAGKRVLVIEGGWDER